MNHNHLSLSGAEALKTDTLILPNWQRLDFFPSNQSFLLLICLELFISDIHFYLVLFSCEIGHCIGYYKPE